MKKRKKNYSYGFLNYFYIFFFLFFFLIVTETAELKGYLKIKLSDIFLS